MIYNFPDVHSTHLLPLSAKLITYSTTPNSSTIIYQNVRRYVIFQFVFHVSVELWTNKKFLHLYYITLHVQIDISQLNF